MSQFMKAFKIFLLSFALMQTPMVTHMAIAQSNQDGQSESAEPSQNRARMSIEHGKSAKEDMGGFLVHLVTTVAIGLLAKTMITYTPVTVDMMIAAAGGAAYIYGEIAANDATRKKMKSKTFKLTYYEDGSVNNLQKEALEKQLKSYQEMQGLMDEKAQMRKTAAAAFFAAAITAGVWGAKLESTSMMCRSAIKGYLSTCAALNPGCAACAAALPTITVTEGKHAAAENTPSQSVVNYKALQAMDVTQLTTITSACSPAAAACGTRSSLRKAIYSFSAMHWGAQLAVSGAVGILMEQLEIGSLKTTMLGVMGPLSMKLDSLMSTPFLRASAFTMMGGLAMIGAKKSEEQADIMKENAEKIQKMLNRMNELQNMNSVDQDIPVLATNNPNNFLSPQGGLDGEQQRQEFPCLTNQKRDAQGRCESVQKKIEQGMAETTAGGFEGLDGRVVDAATGIGNIVDSQTNTGGLTETAKVDSERLSGNANALRDLNRRVQKEINQKREDAGLKPVAFDQNADELGEKFKSVIADASEGTGSGSALQGLLAAGLGSQQDDANEKNGEVNDELEESAQVAGIESSEAFKMPDVKPVDFDFSASDMESSMEPSRGLSHNEEGHTIVDVDDDLDTDGRDIVSNSDVSIFRVISVRYLKSGIPKLLDLE